MGSEKTQSLFAQTLVGDYESKEAWAAISALRRGGSREIFEYAADWCRSGDPLKRARAADVLCQLQATEGTLRDKSYDLITRMLEGEQNPMVLASAISGLGHLGKLDAIPVILRYQNHPDQDVRFAVACALGCFPNDPQAVRGLSQLTMDSCSEVRDWAVFGLGVQGDCDSPEIRDTLLRCLNDTDENVREEAAAGLRKRRDATLKIRHDPRLSKSPSR